MLQNDAVLQLQDKIHFVKQLIITNFHQSETE